MVPESIKEPVPALVKPLVPVRSDAMVAVLLVPSIVRVFAAALVPVKLILEPVIV